jgi:hypothetical protein
MNEKENKGFFETVFEGLGETAAKHINQRLRDVTPLAIDWFIDLLKNLCLCG